MRAPEPATTRRVGDLGVVVRLLRIGRPQWGRLALAAGLGALGAAAGVGLLAGSGYVVDRAAQRPGLGAIAGILALVEVMAFLRGPLRYGERLVTHDAALRALARWRVWLYDHLEPLAPAGLGGWRSGDLLTRAIEDVDVLQDLYVRTMTPLAVAVTASLLSTVVVGLLLPPAAAVLGIALALGMGVPSVVGARTRHRAGWEAELRGRLAADVVDILQGAAELVAFGADRPVLERIATTAAEVDRRASRAANLAGGLGAFGALCTAGAVVGVLALAVGAVAGHRLNPVMIGVLPLAALAAFEPIPLVVAAALRMGDVAAAGRRVLALADVKAPVVDPSSPDEIPEGPLDVALDDVHLRYRVGGPWALDGMTFDLPAGSTLAVLGPSGAGKSSVVNVLMRYWAPELGSVLVGGVPASRLAQRDIRRALALVDQQAQLFSGSIRRNVTLARPDATDDEVAGALRRAQLDEWVATLPEGVDTPVGDQGTRVSGGQRQRIALARALLAGSPVLVLDEPTAGLDETTAARLIDDLLDAGHGHSVLMVTHSEEEADRFGRVLTMDHGRVVASRPGANAVAPGAHGPGGDGGDGAAS